MTEVKSLNNENLVSSLKRHVAEERKIMAVVIEHISEVWRRRLYIDLGYTSLFTKEDMAELVRVKELMSHIKPGASMAEVIVHAAKEFIRRKDPLVQKITAADEVPETKAVPLRVRLAVIQRDKCCQWRHENRLCGSTFQLEVDHRQSLWAGGDHRIKNLQALCSVHNQLKYRREAGIRFC